MCYIKMKKISNRNTTANRLSFDPSYCLAFLGMFDLVATKVNSLKYFSLAPVKSLLTRMELRFPVYSRHHHFRHVWQRNLKRFLYHIFQLCVVQRPMIHRTHSKRWPICSFSFETIRMEFHLPTIMLATEYWLARRSVFAIWCKAVDYSDQSDKWI